MLTTGKKLLKIKTYGGWTTHFWMCEWNQLLNEAWKSQKKWKKIDQNMHRNKWKWKHDNRKPMGFSKSSAKGKVHSNTNLPQETREKSNK